MDVMKILVTGDIVGRSGRDAVSKYIPDLKNRLSIDFIALNVDNAAHGFGVIPEIVNNFIKIGVDAFSGGNHLFDQKEAISYLEKEKRLLRPANMSGAVPGNGVLEAVTKNGKKILVVHLIGQINMPIVGDNPFDYMNKLLQKYKLGENCNAIIVDFHADVTSEKNALGHFLDGRVSLVAGTHTHIPTADERILEFGTAYQTDLGMCGDYNSVIGMQKKTVIDRFMRGYSSKRFEPATGEATFCGLLVETNDKTGLATSIKSIKLGGLLKQSAI